MNLRTMLALPAAVILAVTLGLVGGIVARSVSQWQDARLAALEAHVVRRVLVAKEMISAERGPTNGALGSDLGAAGELPDDLVSALAGARQTSDTALAELLTAPGLAQDEEAVVRRLRMDLATRRGDVDVLLRMPRAERSAARIEDAVLGLAALVPLLFPLSEKATAAVMEAEPTMGAPLAAARTAADLREFAGLIGSQFTAPLALRQPLEPRQIDAIRTLQGRVIELHRLLLSGARIAGAPPAVEQALDAMDRSYFVEGEKLLETTIAAGSAGGDYALTPAQFAAIYVPQMHTIIAVRDALLAQADGERERQLRARWSQMGAALIAAALVVLSVLGSLTLLNRSVVVPLRAVLRRVTRLAQGDRSTQPAVVNATAEVRELAAAIEVLRIAALAADAAEAGRKQRLERASGAVKELLATLRALAARYPELTTGLPELIEALGVLQAQAAVAVAESIQAAVNAATAALAEVRLGAGCLTAAIEQLRAHAASDGVSRPTLRAALLGLEAAIGRPLDAVWLVSELGLTAARAASSGASKDHAARAAIARHVDRVLVACEQVSAAGGGIFGALAKIRISVGSLAELSDDIGPLPVRDMVG